MQFQFKHVRLISDALPLSDVEPPTFIDCPEDPIIQRSEAVCLSRVILDVSEPSAQDNSGYVTVTNFLQNPYPSGNYSLEFIARDPAGLIAVCQIPVQVIGNPVKLVYIDLFNCGISLQVFSHDPQSHCFPSILGILYCCWN